ncbi:unnamed protein product [Darwinula stevensoni]|uniref:Uncharacterized protein n=1 Tax=Darwinula stevensoni TaxID=69355 RepID=A0A7R9AGI4_9CRUS|nr:unnamed protein product [Darwinula stevensoni]CAG0903699.1 unnamed protein product [Darwinula stevensoni]
MLTQGLNGWPPLHSLAVGVSNPAQHPRVPSEFLQVIRMGIRVFWKEGLRADTAVYLNSNKITSLSEGIFRPMLEILTRGDGFLSVKYNPIRCDCELKWLADRPELLREVRGTCENGTNLRDLRPGSFERCRRCPHECVSARQESLCKPGTVDAGNCHFGKTCCRLENPETATVASMSPSLFHNNTHRDVTSAQMNAGNRPCPDGLQCIGKKFQAHCRRGSVKSNSTCPSVNQICCRVAMSQPCPLTHACLHSSARDACEPGTVISAASCRENGICCISTPQNPSRSSPRQHQVASAPEDKSGCSKKKIRSRGGIDGLGEETASSNDTVFDPEDIPNCEPCMGRCTVADRIHECRADGQGDFSMFFRCPGELVCCAFRTPIGERRLDVLPADVAHSRNASPDSIVFGDSRCRMVEALCVLTYVLFIWWNL